MSKVKWKLIKTDIFNESEDYAEYTDIWKFSVFDKLDVSGQVGFLFLHKEGHYVFSHGGDEYVFETRSEFEEFIADKELGWFYDKSIY